MQHDSVEEISSDPLERAIILQNELISRATGSPNNGILYHELRVHFLSDEATKNLLPSFVRTCRTIGHFWSFIKDESATYDGRKKIIREAFAPLFDYLEGANRAPADTAISDTLATFDPEGVHTVWQKALSRRFDDPDGAITSARTLLETVCKRILDEAGETYSEKWDLPKLYNAVAGLLNIAPSQHTETVFKTILGSCKAIVDNLGGLRNKIGDAHGHGGKPVRVAPRHAALAVNLAGAMATFLVETWQERKK